MIPGSESGGIFGSHREKRGTDTVDNTQHLQETDWRAHPSYLLPISPPLRSSSSFPVLLHLLFQIFFLTSCAFEYGQRPWLSPAALFLRERESASSIWCLGITAGIYFPFFLISCSMGNKKPPQGCRGYIESGHRKLPRRKVFSSFLFLLWFTNLYVMKVFR
jgi:hypothetical protein